LAALRFSCFVFVAVSSFLKIRPSACVLWTNSRRPPPVPRGPPSPPAGWLPPGCPHCPIPPFRPPFDHEARSLAARAAPSLGPWGTADIPPSTLWRCKTCTGSVFPSFLHSLLSRLAFFLEGTKKSLKEFLLSHRTSAEPAPPGPDLRSRRPTDPPSLAPLPVPCTLKDLRQLARGPFKYPRPGLPGLSQGPIWRSALARAPCTRLLQSQAVSDVLLHTRPPCLFL